MAFVFADSPFDQSFAEPFPLAPREVRQLPDVTGRCVAGPPAVTLQQPPAVFVGGMACADTRFAMVCPQACFFEVVPAVALPVGTVAEQSARSFDMDGPPCYYRPNVLDDEGPSGPRSLGEGPAAQPSPGARAAPRRRRAKRACHEQPQPMLPSHTDWRWQSPSRGDGIADATARRRFGDSAAAAGAAGAATAAPRPDDFPPLSAAAARPLTRRLAPAGHRDDTAATRRRGGVAAAAARGEPAETDMEVGTPIPEFCEQLLARLGDGVAAEVVEAVLGQVLEEDVAALAQRQGSCRLVQRLLGVAGARGCDQLARHLIPRTVELYESPHGNYVLAKLIEVLPSASLRPIIERIEQQGCVVVARHTYGCRIIERLIEHGSEEEMRRLNDDIVGAAEALSRHPFGTFVVQSLLEHGETRRRTEVVRQLLPTISHLATHRTASHVVQKALAYTDEDCQRSIAAELRAGAGLPLLEVAASKYGSYVVEDLQGLHCAGAGPLLRSVREELARAGPEQLASAHFHRVGERFGLGLAPAPGAALPQQQELQHGTESSSEGPC